MRISYVYTLTSALFNLLLFLSYDLYSPLVFSKWILRDDFLFFVLASQKGGEEIWNSNSVTLYSSRVFEQYATSSHVNRQSSEGQIMPMRFSVQR